MQRVSEQSRQQHFQIKLCYQEKLERFFQTKVEMNMD